MFWNEKIDQLKKDFPAKEFSVPYTEGNAILKTIALKFTKIESSTDITTDWSDRIRGKTFLKEIPRQTFNQEIQNLNQQDNYWCAIALGNYPTAKLMIYDCKPSAIEVLFFIAPGNFYIIDKKYTWFILFERNDSETISIVKSGNNPTPID